MRSGEHFWSPLVLHGTMRVSLEVVRPTQRTGAPRPAKRLSMAQVQVLGALGLPPVGSLCAGPVRALWQLPG